MNQVNTNTAVKFDAMQIEAIINRVVSLIADEKDHEFFRGVLYCKADACGSSAEFSAFIAKLLK